MPGLNQLLETENLPVRKYHKDEIIEVLKTLNKTMEFLNQHIEQPIKKLNSAVSDFENNGFADTEKFISVIRDNTRQMTAVVKSISDEIKELDKTKDEMTDLDIDLSVLEEKYKSHLAEAK